MFSQKMFMVGEIRKVSHKEVMKEIDGVSVKNGDIYTYTIRTNEGVNLFVSSKQWAKSVANKKAKGVLKLKDPIPSL